jgi:CRP-like cAMP-binding protein
MASGVRQQATELLQKVPLFHHNSKEEVQSIAHLGTEVQADAGQVLTEQGRTGKEFFLVVEGEARCSIDGTEVARFGKGDFFGELSLLSDAPRSATIVAETPMTLLVLDSREFAAMLQDNPQIALKMLHRMADRIRELDRSLTHTH